MTMSEKPRRRKSRGNGTGCAYYSKKYRYWIAQTVDGYRDPSDLEKQRIPIKKTKGGFKRREDALAYCAKLKETQDKPQLYTLKEVYDLWEPWYEPRVASIAGYRAAFKHYGVCTIVRSATSRRATCRSVWTPARPASGPTSR